MARKKYLDGLRGLAALGVVAFHSSTFFSAATWTETFGDVPNLVLSRFINGNFMVCIFFLLSGYVLTIPRAANPALPSGYWGELIIRRYFRLTPVALVSVILLYILWGGIGIPNASMTDYGPGFAWMKNEYMFTPTLYDAVYNGIVGIYTGNFKYNLVLWTLRVELIGSVLLFCMFALFPKNKSFIVSSSILSIIIIFLHYGGHLKYGIYICLFFIGSLVYLTSLTIKQQKVKYTFFLLALWLASISIYTPEGKWIAHTFSISSSQMDAIIHSIGAILLLLIVLSSKRLQKILCIKPILWLGKISFSVYAIHSVIIFTIALHIFILLVPLCQIRMAGLITYLFIFVASLILAAILTKYVDTPSQHFAKWFSHWLINSDYPRIDKREREREREREASAAGSR